MAISKAVSLSDENHDWLLKGSIEEEMTYSGFLNRVVRKVRKEDTKNNTDLEDGKGNKELRS